jgi:hypothetical protein
LDAPIINEVASRNGQLMAIERVDLEYGIMDDEGDLMIFVGDSRRMMPWEPPL